AVPLAGDEPVPVRPPRIVRVDVHYPQEQGVDDLDRGQVGRDVPGDRVRGHLDRLPPYVLRSGHRLGLLPALASYRLMSRLTRIRRATSETGSGWSSSQVMVFSISSRTTGVMRSR